MMESRRDRKPAPEAGRRGRPDRTRRGIALIVVLGFLAVLLIMGVGFAIHMRIERLSARHYHQFVAARELVYAGLARAIDTADRELGGDPFPSWTILRSRDASDHDVLDTVAAEAYTFMPWIPQLGESPRGTSTGGQPTGLAAGDVLLNLSDRSHAHVRNPQRTAPLNRGFRNEWQAGDQYKIVRAEDNPPVWHNVATNGPLVQRFSFSVVNVSGLLDAHVFGRTPRYDGTDPGEVYVRDLPEMFGQLDSILSLRMGPSTASGRFRYMWGYRYATQEEFYNLTRGPRQRYGWGPIFPYGSQHTNVFHFSYFPTGLDRMGELEAGYTYLRPTGHFPGTYYDDSNRNLHPMPVDFMTFGVQGDRWSPNAFYAPSGWRQEAPDSILMRMDIGKNNPIRWVEDDYYKNLVVAAQDLFDKALFNTSMSGERAEEVRTNIAAWAYGALLDYIDPGNVPRRLDGPNGAAVPMLNEFAVTNFFALEVRAQAEITEDPITGISTTNWVPHRVRPTVYNQAGIEAWHPMAATGTVAYALRADMEYTNLSNPAYPAGMMPDPADFTRAIDHPIPNPAPDSFHADTSEHGITGPLATHILYGFDYHDGAVRVDYFYDLHFRNVEIVRISDGVVVDRVDDIVLPVRNEIVAPVPESTIPLVTESAVVHSLEAVDPRWNWDIENRAMWRVSTNRHTLGTYNAATVDYLAGTGSNLWILDPSGEQTVAQYAAPVLLSLPPPDEINLGADPVMFVAHRPLRRVGELGYINYYPWRSFRITGDDPLHPVVDYFSVNHPREGFFVRDIHGSSSGLAGSGIVELGNARLRLSGHLNTLERREVVPELNYGPGGGQAPFPAGDSSAGHVVHAAAYIHIENAPRTVSFTLQSSGSGGKALYVQNESVILRGSGTDTESYEFPYNGFFPVDVYYWNTSPGNRSIKLEMSPQRPLLSAWPNTGYLNPNTPHADVLATAFQRMPLDSDYVENPSLGFPAWSDARAMAEAFINAGPFQRPSQVAAAPAIRNASGIDRFERQALVSNLIEMLHLRGQVFVIPVSGQVWNQETEEVIADQRAVAVVWRDPFPDNQGHRRAVVRIFQWLLH